MTKKVLSKEAHEYLLRHLISIEEEKNYVSEVYYANEPAKRGEFTDFVENYISYIDNFIQNTSISEDPLTTIPFSTIGNIVEVEDMKRNEITNYRIISPFLGSKDFRIDEDFASYLSPIGKALLLKKVGDKTIIETPTGILEYRIKSFRFP